MKRILNIVYKLGKASYRLPNPSFKPFKSIYKAFKAGRDDAKPYTVVVD